MENAPKKISKAKAKQAKLDAIAKANARKNYLNALRNGDTALADAIGITFGFRGI